MVRTKRKSKDLVKITRRAAETLKAIQAVNSADEKHVLRIDIEGEGYSLWLGPGQNGDIWVSGEDTVPMRATPDLAKLLRKTSMIIDCMDHEDGPRLIVYPENDPPPELSRPKKTGRPAKKPGKK